MKKYKSLQEKAIKVDVSFVPHVLNKLKNKIVGKDLGNVEIEDMLNKAFANYLIHFDSTYERSRYTSSYIEVGIVEGSIYDNGEILISYDREFYTKFEDDYYYNEFIKVVSSIVYHERVHKYQLYHSKNKLSAIDTSSNVTYLSNKHEIQAHAQQTVFELLSMGYTKPEILKKIKNHKEIQDFVGSDAFYKYWDYFGSTYDIKDKEVDKYNYVWPLFLKYIYSALEI